MQSFNWKDRQTFQSILKSINLFIQNSILCKVAKSECQQCVEGFELVGQKKAPKEAF